MTQLKPTFGKTVTDTTALAAALGVEALDTRAPGQEVNCGSNFFIVALPTRKAVDAAVINRARLDAVFAAAGIQRRGVYAFSVENGADGATAYSRMLPSGGLGVPATGSAVGPAGCFAAKYRFVPRDRIGGMVFQQGVFAKRPPASRQGHDERRRSDRRQGRRCVGQWLARARCRCRLSPIHRVLRAAPRSPLRAARAAAAGRRADASAADSGSDRHDCHRRLEDGVIRRRRRARRKRCAGRTTRTRSAGHAIEGSHVVVQEAAAPDMRAEGVVIEVNKKQQQITVRVGDKQTQTLRVLDGAHAAYDHRRPRVRVALAEQAGEKVAYEFTRVP